MRIAPPAVNHHSVAASYYYNGCCCCCQLEEASKLEHAELEELCKERTALNSKIETLTAGNLLLCTYCGKRISAMM